jgi:hypothetical protein
MTENPCRLLELDPNLGPTIESPHEYRARVDHRIELLSQLPVHENAAAPSRCVDCGNAISLTPTDGEPLCLRCAAIELAHVEAFAFDGQAEAAAQSKSVPVEEFRRAVRPFGLGFGELPSSRITQSLAETERERVAGLRLGAFAVVSFFATFVGLVYLALAALR